MRDLINLVESYQPQFVYVTNCTSDAHGEMGEAIEDMTDIAQELSYREFEHLVGRHQLSQIFDNYDWSKRPTGLTLQKDYTMQEDAFFRSVWRGIPCVYCVNSGIEYIFTSGGQYPSSPYGEEPDEDED